MPEMPPAKGQGSQHQRRLKWAMRGVQESLHVALERDRSAAAMRLAADLTTDRGETVARLIMERADPTPNKRFTPWLVREYTEGRLILEDLGAANETLTLFQRYAPRLKPEQRDIQRYGSLAAAWEVVRGFAERDEAQSNKAQRALDRAKAYEESRILRQDPNGFTVAVPLTEFAAKWWGKGTRWCTAAENNNQFWHYHKEAPLIVIVIPGHGKFQLWGTASDFQFMDAADRPVSLDLSRSLWLYVKAILVHAISISPRVLAFIPLEHCTPEVFFAAVKQDGLALKSVPPDRLTYKVSLAAVQQYWRALEWVPEEHRTAELCCDAVRQSGWALKWVPEQFRSPELCLAAVQVDGIALEWVPEEHRSAKICRAAITQWGGALQYISEGHLTYNLCLTAVRKTGRSLEVVPERYRTAALCLAAVQQDGRALEWVPEEHLNNDLCLAAVQQDGRALEWVPEEHLTYDLCLAAVQQNGRALEWVPEEHLNAQLCLAAVRQNGRAAQWVPEEVRSYDLCLSAIQQGVGAFRYVPRQHRDAELCLVAVQTDPQVIKYVPHEHLTHDLYLAALLADRGALQFIPGHLQSELLAKLAPGPMPVIAWGIGVLDSLAERLKPTPHSDETLTMN